MAAMAAAIFGSIFTVTQNRALARRRAVERGGAAGRVPPHRGRRGANETGSQAEFATI
jgi:hypothetical protein